MVEKMDYDYADTYGVSTLGMRNFFAAFSDVYAKPEYPWTDPSGVVWIQEEVDGSWSPISGFTRTKEITPYMNEWEIRTSYDG